MKLFLRRAFSLTLYVVLFLILTVGFPVFAPLAFISDLIRKSKMVGVRLLCFGWIFLGSELFALLTVGQYIRFRYQRIGPQRYAEANYALQRWWSNLLFRAMTRLFSLQFEVSGQDVLSSGPYLLFMRHASIIDTLFPSFFAANPYKMHIRYIMKSELRFDPALDLMGVRIPNYFLNRRSRDTAAELANIRALATGIGERDGVVIWPEGTRYTTSKWQYALAQMKERGVAPDIIQKAASMTHVMPPRPAGSLALLEGAPAADVVFCAHVGLDGLSTVNDVFSGDLVGKKVQVKFWRVPRSQVPQDRHAQTLWLMEQWQAVDQYVATASATATTTTTTTTTTTATKASQSKRA